MVSEWMYCTLSVGLFVSHGFYTFMSRAISSYLKCLVCYNMRSFLYTVVYGALRDEVPL